MGDPATTSSSTESSSSNNNGGGSEGDRDRNSTSSSSSWSCCRWRLFSAPAEWVWLSADGFGKKATGIARDDPRRVAHSFKVGFALTLVSVVYYVTPLFNGFGGSAAMWAVLTVVIVMEFTVGATLSKGLNRALATLVASCLAVGAHEVASLIVPSSEKAESILLVVFVFFVASAATFALFIPEIKARFDYGVSIFILTFSLVAVSSYRVEEVLPLALQRTSTILAGVAICLCTTVFVFPVWAGEDLHKLVAGNLDKLAEFLEGENAGSENLEAKDFLHVYKSVLGSKDKEESLCALAKWEPPHGKFRFGYPWSQYQELGTLCRQCASAMEALASYIVILGKSQVIANAPIGQLFHHQRLCNQYPEANPELCLEVPRTCNQMSLHSARALRELASAIRSRTTPFPANDDLSAAMNAANDCRSELMEDAALLRVMHAAVIASLLSDLVMQIDKITESVDNLARLARFKSPEKITQNDVVINILLQYPLSIASASQRYCIAIDQQPNNKHKRWTPLVGLLRGWDRTKWRENTVVEEIDD
ncbi:hypothetical protein U9M48_002449 [Paspalum notatum var. saurae]|uniref:Aluminum-activated malate transporter n=1 Tax=Paspalum notatum var. saurae TaxID=547442 RepID=A0AAQ3SDH8_PASNO